ncbi:MAG: hypothetical protein KJO69_04825 [Gammaproteobacteria bacterium]|nr:hypothetical protein [Gammaproteobacteria bacterium]
MKYIHTLVIAFTALCLSITLRADDMPPEYKPLSTLIGDWTGTAKITIIDGKNRKVHSYKKSVQTHYDSKRNSIVMKETELNPWTGKPTVINSETRWDSYTKMYKSIIWSSDGEVRMFTIQARDGILRYDQIDKEIGSKFECKVSLSDEGNLIERGSKTFTKPRPISVEWSVKYSAKKSG